MVAAVERLPRRRVLEPVVGAAVDDHDVVAEGGGEGAALPVRQRQEDHVVPGQRLSGRRLEHAVGERQQVRLQGPEPLTRIRVAGEGTDLHLGMAEKQPEQLSPGVAAGPGHRDPCRHDA